MGVTLLILSIVCFVCSVALIYVRGILAPVAAFMGLLFAWLSGMLPLNSTIIVMWLCMTALVTTLQMLHTPQVRGSRAGVGYMVAGAFTGMAAGLPGVTLATTPAMLYGIMIVATVAGTFFGFLLYTNTPRGRGLDLASGRFFGYLLAKGFPVALTVMQIGVVAVLLVWMRGYAA